MKYVVLFALATLTASLASTANAQFRTPEAAIKYRQSVMTVQGRAFYGSIGAMVNGRAPYDARAAAENAELVLMLSKLPWIAFGPGTDQGAATDAKPNIWSEPAKFKDLADKMQTEVVKLAAAAKPAIRTASKPPMAQPAMPARLVTTPTPANSPNWSDRASCQAQCALPHR